MTTKSSTSGSMVQKPTIIDDVVEYANRYGLAALGYAFMECVKSGEIRLTDPETEAIWEYGGNPGV